MVTLPLTRSSIHHCTASPIQQGQTLHICSQEQTKIEKHKLSNSKVVTASFSYCFSTQEKYTLIVQHHVFEEYNML